MTPIRAYAEHVHAKRAIARKASSSLSSFCTLLQKEQDPEAEFFFPNSFEPNKVRGAYPRNISRWNWLERELQSSPSPGVVVRLPLWWQLATTVANACHVSGCFPFLSPASNMPLGREAIRQMPAGTVITTPEDALLFANHLKEHHVPLPHVWICVSDVTKTVVLPEVTIRRSLHIFPGVPLFEECRVASGIFHASSDFEVTHQGGSLVITGGKSDPIPFLDCTIPTVFSEHACKCGQVGYVCLN